MDKLELAYKVEALDEITALRARIAEAEQERDDARTMLFATAEACAAHVKRIAELEAKADNMATALRFYADNASYCKLFTPHLKEGDPRGLAPVLQDDGKLAREALGKHYGGEG